MTPATTIAELNQLLAGTSVTALTLSTPAETITLRRNSSLPGGTRQPGTSSAALSAPWTPGSSPGVTITAPCSGRFLHAHPLQKEPSVQVGQAVKAGAVVGLVQVGPLLLHVTAPQAGTVVSIAVEAVVGYGTVLVHLAGESD